MILILFFMKVLDNDIDGDNGRIDYDGNGVHDDKDDDGYNDDVETTQLAALYHISRQLSYTPIT